MADDQAKDPKKEKDNPKSPIPDPAKELVKPLDDKNEANPKDEGAPKIDKSPKYVHPRIEYCKPKKLNIVDYSNIAMSLATIVLAIFTYGLWKAAVRTFEITETEFRSQHQAFLQIRNLDTTSFRIGEYPQIEYQFANLGNDPAMITKGEMGVKYGTMNDRNPFTANPDFVPDTTIFEQYVTKESPYIGAFIPRRNTSASLYDKIKRGEYFVFFFGKIEYINQVTKVPRIYFFNYKMILSTKYGSEILKNINIDSADIKLLD
jgi:hypothetical protein